MLYVTTRNNRDVFTAKRILGEDRGEDGGFYVPFHAPAVTQEELEKLSSASFNQRIALVLNRLFQTKFTGWDVDFCIGRNPVKLVNLRHRIVMGEFWHNPDWDYSRMEHNLAGLLRKAQEKPGNWTFIAIRIAVLTAACLELRNRGLENPDIAMVSGDFLWPISAWYARSWGVPMGNLIICCNENKNLWDLICHGQLRTDTLSIETELPEADIPVPENLERLIYGCGGIREVERFLDCCRRGSTYFADEAMLQSLQKGNFVSVVSARRIRDTIPGVLGTHDYLLPSGMALAYAGLLDYRARKGSLRPALVIGDKSPRIEADRLKDLLSLSREDLDKYL